RPARAPRSPGDGGAQRPRGARRAPRAFVERGTRGRAVRSRPARHERLRGGAGDPRGARAHRDPPGRPHRLRPARGPRAHASGRLRRAPDQAGRVRRAGGGAATALRRRLTRHRPRTERLDQQYVLHSLNSRVRTLVSSPEIPSRSFVARGSSCASGTSMNSRPTSSIVDSAWPTMLMPLCATTWLMAESTPGTFSCTLTMRLAGPLRAAV